MQLHYVVTLLRSKRSDGLDHLFEGSYGRESRLLSQMASQYYQRVVKSSNLKVASSDVAALQTTAERTPDGKFFIVNGYKKWVTNGMYADNIITAVRTGPQGGKGITMLVIDPRTKGVTRTKMSNTGSSASGKLTRSTSPSTLTK
jgi:Acyl-CoA dehydrogenase, middle domain